MIAQRHLCFALLPLIGAWGLASACSGSAWGGSSWRASSEPYIAEFMEVHEHGDEPMDPLGAASTGISVALATGRLHAMMATPGSGVRALRRDASEGAVEQRPTRRIVTTEEQARRPERTLVTIEATAGPPVESAARDRRQQVEVFALPIEVVRVTSRFGARIDPITGQRGRMHRGTDFGAPTGTPILATASGEVIMGGNCSAGTGNCVVIDHNGGWRSQYFHMHRVDVRPGQHVRQGQVIGQVGTTGRSTGPHLHFQIGREGQAMDPELLLGQRVE